MSNLQPPSITPGEQLPLVSKPWPGRRATNKLIGLFNLMMRAKVTSPDSSVTGSFKFGSVGEMLLELQASGGGGSGNGMGGVNAVSGSYSTVVGDLGKMCVFSSSSSGTFILPNTPFSATWFVLVTNNGTGTVTVSPGTQTMDGGSSFTLAQNQGVIIFTDGVNYFSDRGIGGAGGSTQMYLIDSSYNASNMYDYIPCKATNDGSTTYGSVVNVAKMKEVRPSLTSEVVDGVTFTYTYTDDNHRSSSDGTSSQNENCYPRYLIGKMLFASQASGGYTAVTGASWVDLTTRLWIRKYTG